MIPSNNRYQWPRLASGFLLACILTTRLAAHGGNPAKNRTVSDEEMREIVSILFERELGTPPDGKEIVVLLGPPIEPELDSKACWHSFQAVELRRGQTRFRIL